MGIGHTKQSGGAGNSATATAGAGGGELADRSAMAQKVADSRYSMPQAKVVAITAQ